MVYYHWRDKAVEVDDVCSGNVLRLARDQIIWVVVRWADAQIMALDSASGSLLELSTTSPSKTGDLLSHLRVLASGADFWSAFRAVLGPLHDHISSNPSRAEYFANELYRTAISFDSGEVPKDLSFVYRFDDAFSIAREGTYGRPEDVFREFLAELARFKGEVQAAGGNAG
jgi:hypothetical protein